MGGCGSDSSGILPGSSGVFELLPGCGPGPPIYHACFGTNDDRIGRCLDRLFDADIPTLTLAIVVHAVREFAVDLDELHNDSTTVTLHGDYETADHERTLRGKLRLAVTHGHNKDHRPDLKQLLYILTVSRDGAVPVHFRVESGNATDDRSHIDTWKILCKLMESASRGWRSLNGSPLLVEVVKWTVFKDGIKEKPAA